MNRIVRRLGLMTLCLLVPWSPWAVRLSPTWGKRWTCTPAWRRGPQSCPAPALQPSPGALGPEAPYLPLVRPPQVQRVWITAHLNDDGDLIAGHWVYLMVSPSQWLLQGLPGNAEELRLRLPAPIAPEPAE